MLHNAARRYGHTATSIDVALSGVGATVTVTYPDDVPVPGDPGPDPAIVILGDALSEITDTLINEQTRVSNLFAERIDLQAQRTELARDKAALEADKATVESLLSIRDSEKATLEDRLAAKQKELDDYKAANPPLNPAAVRP